MRSNGLHLALDALLASAAALAQSAEPPVTPPVEAGAQVEAAPRLDPIAVPPATTDPTGVDGNVAAPESERPAEGDGGALDPNAAPATEQSDPAADVGTAGDADADTEAAFEDIYGPAEAGGAGVAYDPWEKYNRKA